MSSVSVSEFFAHIVRVALLCVCSFAQIDYSALGAAVSTLSSNLTTLSKNVQALAGLLPQAAGPQHVSATRVCDDCMRKER